MWTQKGRLSKSRDPKGLWCGEFKCNKFLQETADAPTGSNINKLAADAKRLGNTIPGNQAKPGNVYLLPNPNPVKSGHGILLGNNGEFIHASDGMGGAVRTGGWSRVFYRWGAHGNKDVVITGY